MKTRTLQYQNGSFFTVLPMALIEMLGLEPGEKLSFSIEKGKIVVAPVTACKQETGAASPTA